MSGRFYIQNRLYNVNNRLAALDLYERIEEWIQKGVLVDMESSYLPFKSTNNTGCDGEDGIFEMDEKALKSCTAVLGYFDGWTYDPGCAFEIGCGYAWGYPVYLVTTDIFKSSVGDSKEYYYGSRLVEYMAKIVAVPDLNQDIGDYRRRNEDVLERAMEGLKKNLKEDFSAKRPEPEKTEMLPAVYDYYFDPNFKYTECGRMLLARMMKAADASGRKYVVGDNQGDIEEDLKNLRRSRQSVFYFDTAEPNVDSGILEGFAYGIGQRPLVYAPGQQRIQMSGKWPIQLNTMNYWCAEKVTDSIEELEELIERHKQ